METKGNVKGVTTVGHLTVISNANLEPVAILLNVVLTVIHLRMAGLAAPSLKRRMTLTQARVVVMAQTNQQEPCNCFAEQFLNQMLVNGTREIAACVTYCFSLYNHSSY